MQNAPARKQLRYYDVHELSLVRHPDIGDKRRALILKRAGEGGGDTLTPEQLRQLMDLNKQRINKSRLPVLDGVDNPAAEQAQLSQQGQRTLQAVARVIAPFRDELTLQDLADVGNAIGLQPGGSGDNDPMAQGGDNPDGGQDYLANGVDAGDANDSNLAAGNDQEGANEEFGDDVDDDEDGSDRDLDEQEDWNNPDGDDDDDPDAGTGASEDAATEDEADAVDENDDDSEDDTGEDEGAGDPATHQAMAWKTPVPAGVKPDDHAAATAGAKDHYLASMKKKGYNLQPKGKKPPPSNAAPNDSRKPPPPGKGKRPMPNDPKQEQINKSSWKAFTPEQRETLEPILKSAQMAERLGEENKELVLKHSALAAEVKALQDERTERELILKFSEFRNLPDPSASAKLAMSMQDEARAQYIAQMQAHNEHIESINKSAAPFGGEIGSRFGGEKPMRTGDDDGASELDKLVETRVNKSAEAGNELSYADAYTQVLKSAPGRRAYARAEAERLSRAPGVMG